MLRESKAPAQGHRSETENSQLGFRAQVRKHSPSEGQRSVP